jgi:hypothetical protein
MGNPINGAALFDRYFRMQVGTLDVSDLDAKFTVKRDLKKKPNQLKATLYNLNPDHAAAVAHIAKQKGDNVGRVFVRIHAGYKDLFGEIFYGSVRTAFSQIQGPDVVTELESGDGEDPISKARVNVSFSKGAPLSQVIKTLVDATGLMPGNVQEFVSQATMRAGNSYAGGVVLSGSAYDELQAICRSAGFECSVQGGKLLFLEPGKTTGETVYELSPETGLIDTPTVDTKGVMTCKSLLIPHLAPGRRIMIKSRFLSATYKITELNYSGDTRGDDWTVKVQGKLPD